LFLILLISGNGAAVGSARQREKKRALTVKNDQGIAFGPRIRLTDPQIETPFFSLMLTDSRVRRGSPRALGGRWRVAKARAGALYRGVEVTSAEKRARRTVRPGSKVGNR
jgi:hypothetical protein